MFTLTSEKCSLRVNTRRHHHRRAVIREGSSLSGCNRGTSLQATWPIKLNGFHVRGTYRSTIEYRARDKGVDKRWCVLSLFLVNQGNPCNVIDHGACERRRLYRRFMVDLLTRGDYARWNHNRSANIDLYCLISTCTLLAIDREFYRSLRLHLLRFHRRFTRRVTIILVLR